MIRQAFSRNSISIAVGTNMRVLFISQRGAELLGRNKGEVLGRDFFESLVPPERRARLRDAFGRILKGEREPGPFADVLVLAGRGGERTVEWRVMVMKDDRGRRTGIFGTGRLLEPSEAV